MHLSWSSLKGIGEKNHRSLDTYQATVEQNHVRHEAVVLRAEDAGRTWALRISSLELEEEKHKSRTSMIRLFRGPKKGWWKGSPKSLNANLNWEPIPECAIL